MTTKIDMAKICRGLASTGVAERFRNTNQSLVAFGAAIPEPVERYAAGLKRFGGRREGE